MSTNSNKLDIGGVAFRSNVYGFGANNVFNYEVVLSNGTIINANSTSHAELFWALKVAGTNYGIVTRFDMRIYSSPAIWGATTVYPATEQNISEIFSDYEQYAHDNDNVDVFKSALFTKSNGQGMTTTVVINSAGKQEPPITSADHIFQSEQLSSTQEVVHNVITSLLETPARTAWFTMTTIVDTQLFLDLNAILGGVFHHLEGKG